MTFTQLRTLVAVVATGSVRAAAEQLVVSQPAVSATLASLQREVGVPLVARAGRGLEVTAAGLAFARQARQILQRIEDAQVAARETLDPKRGRVRLAAVTTAGEHVVPRFLATFRKGYPDAELSLEVGNRDRVWELLMEHEVDLAIGGRPPGGGLFVTLALRPNVLVLVAAGRGSPAVLDVSLDELSRQTLLLREPGSGTRSTAEELYDELGIAPKATLTVGSNGAIRESVQVGLGVTLISRDAVARELEDGALEEWRCPTLPRHRAWHLVSRTTDDLPATAALFVGHLAAGGTSAEGFTLVGGAVA
ncbi:MAG: LysR substrate-binding domain-containing protein [Acidimicrobiales bacterium]